jgi:hypothetical protein
LSISWAMKMPTLRWCSVWRLACRAARDSPSSRRSS